MRFSRIWFFHFFLGTFISVNFDRKILEVVLINTPSSFTLGGNFRKFIFAIYVLFSDYVNKLKTENSHLFVNKIGKIIFHNHSLCTCELCLSHRGFQRKFRVFILFVISLSNLINYWSNKIFCYVRGSNEWVNSEDKFDLGSESRYFLPSNRIHAIKNLE